MATPAIGEGTAVFGTHRKPNTDGVVPGGAGAHFAANFGINPNFGTVNGVSLYDPDKGFPTSTIS